MTGVSIAEEPCQLDARNWCAEQNLGPAGVNVTGVQKNHRIILSRLGRMTGVQITASGTGVQYKTWSAGVNVTGMQITASGTGVQFFDTESLFWKVKDKIMQSLESRPLENLRIIHPRFGRMTGVQITASETGVQFKTWGAGVNVTGVQITTSGTGVQFKNLEYRCKCDWRADHCKRNWCAVQNLECRCK